MSTAANTNDVSQVSLYITLVTSILGLIVSMAMYIATSKWICCGNESLFDYCKPKLIKIFKEKVRCSCIQKCFSDESDEPEKPLFSSTSTVTIATVLHLVGKPIMIVANIVYLVIIGFPPGTGIDLTFGFGTTPHKNMSSIIAGGRETGYFITFFFSLYEIVIILFAPLYFGFFWLCCKWTKKLEKQGCVGYLEVLRFGDLEFAALFVPFGNVGLFILGGPWYVLIVVRLAFYAVTFATAVIAGVRAVWIICCCCYLCECGCNNDNIEIKNWKHLILNILVKVVSIALKLLTCSSALATYLTVGILQPFPIRVAYFTFTLVRGFSALFSLMFTASLLRWEVLNDEEKVNKSSRLGKVLGFFNEYEPQKHLAFIMDLVTYFGLIALNIYIAAHF